MALESDARTRLTYEDYVRIPSDGRRHEIIDGEHVVNPAPRSDHQAAIGELFVQLYGQIWKAGRGRVFLSPLDVELSRSDIVQPDVLVILNQTRAELTPSRVRGAPDLVVEVLSPSTEKLDRGKKKVRYELQGVREYWIVDVDAGVLEQFVLEDGAYALIGHHTARVSCRVATDVEIDLTEVWRVADPQQ